MWSSFLCHPPSVFYFIVVTLRVYFISSWSQVEAEAVVSYPCRPVSLQSPVLWSPAGQTLPPAAQILPADPSSQQRPEPVYSGRGRHTAPSSNWENREEETIDDALHTRNTRHPALGFYSVFLFWKECLEVSWENVFGSILFFKFQKKTENMSNRRVSDQLSFHINCQYEQIYCEFHLFLATLMSQVGGHVGVVDV